MVTRPHVFISRGKADGNVDTVCMRVRVGLAEARSVRRVDASLAMRHMLLISAAIIGWYWKTATCRAGGGAGRSCLLNCSTTGSAAASLGGDGDGGGGGDGGSNVDGGGGGGDGGGGSGGDGGGGGGGLWAACEESSLTT